MLDISKRRGTLLLMFLVYPNLVHVISLILSIKSENDRVLFGKLLATLKIDYEGFSC